MRYVQVGILACLVTISGLLFAIYRDQAAQAVTQDAATAESLMPPEFEDGALAEAVSPAPAPQPNRYVAPKSAPVPARAVKPQPPRRAAAPAPVETAPPTPEPIPVATAAPVIRADHSPALIEERRAIEAPIEAPPMPARTVTLDAGTPVRIRLDHTLSTQRNVPGDAFTASLDAPLVQDGLIIADKGARVEGRVVDARKAGRVKGLSYLELELTTLHTDDGQQIRISSSQFAQDGPKTRRDDLEKVGIGAGVGAVIGAIAGGGKGAAIGAAAGAGAGAGTAAATRGEPVVLRPETRIDFTLDEAATITEQL